MLRFFQVALTFVTTCYASLAVAQEKTESSQTSERAYQLFEEKIRPALIEHCQDCHAADTELSGGLALDSADGWRIGGDSGSAIVPREPEKSLLFKAISYSDPNLQMPPDGILDKQVINDFQNWIKAGAPDPRAASSPIPKKKTGLPVERASEHWAYRPIKLANPSGKSQSIDDFVDAAIEERNLSVAPLAEQSALIRRLYFDLTGLPPTATEISQYVSSLDPTKYEALVDQLLASPHYGEHIARKWMDVARYAESITLRGFVIPTAWRYRDYLVRSFNSDRPFDTMIREQLAGDLLPSHANQAEFKAEQLIATTFLAMGNTNLERQDKAQLEMDYVDEQLQTVGRAFLGQTIGCARCHDHKFDPIPTSDYYALAGIFHSATAMRHDNVSKWIELPLPLSDKEEARIVELESELQKLASKTKSLEADLKQLQQQAIATEFEGIVIDGVDAILNGSWRDSTSVEGFVGDSYLVGTSGTATFELPALDPGSYEVRISYTPFNNRSSKTRVTLQHDLGTEDFSVDQTTLPNQNLPFLALGKFQFGKQPGKLVVHTAGANGSVIADAVQLVRVDAKKPETSRSTRRAYLNEIESIKASMKSIKDRSNGLKKEIDDRAKYLTIVEEKKPADIAICIRGDIHNPGQVVPRGFLTAIPPKFGRIDSETSGRKEFADWVTSPENPLTARVYANRVWLWMMGRGIVNSPNNFGTTGSQPSHPKLLDWLASDLLQNNWSTKRLIKLIAMSEAYRRSTDYEQDNPTLDPVNEFYWRANVRKLSVEALRDAMLKVSGEIDLSMEGTLLKKGLSSDYNYRHNSSRRSIYSPVLRNSLPELFEVFDFADSSMSTGVRPRTTVAPQELALMNHPWVEARTQAAAQKLLGDFDLESNWVQADLEQAIGFFYLECLGRKPTNQELEITSEFLQTLRGKKERTGGVHQFVHAVFGSIDFRYLD